MFEGATNRTAIFICEKTKQYFTYPVTYNTWRGPSRISQDVVLETVLAQTTRHILGAIPVEPHKKTSPWLTAPERALLGIQKVLGKSDYKGYEGCNTGGLNGCYWIHILDKLNNGNLLIENLSDVGKIKVKQHQDVIEPDLVYPLLRGRDVWRWHSEPSCHLILAQDPMRRAGIPETEMKRKYPKTYNYLKEFEDQLRKRSGYRRYFKQTDPFYSMYNVGPYTLAPWKVMWPEVGHTTHTGVCGPLKVESEKPALPDHTIIAVSCQSGEEAHYVCALLNSSPVQAAVRGYIVLHPSPHVLEHIAIPRFSSTNELHCHLADLSYRCHTTINDDGQKIYDLEAEIDEIAAKLWGITSDELQAIRTSERELSSGNNKVDEIDEYKKEEL